MHLGIRSTVAAAALLFLAVALAFADPVPRMLLVAQDRTESPLVGFRFAYAGVETKATLGSGATFLELPPGHDPGRRITLLLLASSEPEWDWFLINRQVNVPADNDAATVVLMRRREFRDIAATVRDEAAKLSPDDRNLTPQETRRVLEAAASTCGLSPEQLKSALESFAQTENLKDQGIAAYLDRELSTAEKLLEESAATQEDGLVETFRYLGASQYEQGKFPEAVATFRKANTLKPDDATILSWFGSSLQKTAQWPKAEAAIRKALEIHEQAFGPNHSRVAGHAGNLGALLMVLNRFEESEPLMRRALKIHEDALGPEHPRVATDLNNLANLLRRTYRSARAEPLLKRALRIDEKALGLHHPSVARDLVNLASILSHITGRTAEAESMFRRALRIDEVAHGPKHPNVAEDLSHLADLLRHGNRMIEAEELMRRALRINEEALGPEHPMVASDLRGLGYQFFLEERFDEAEPLLKRALRINDQAYGPQHPNVARDLHNLVALFRATNRLDEAEPLMRRLLSILAVTTRERGLSEPNFYRTVGEYVLLLRAQKKSEEEIEAAIDEAKAGLNREAPELSPLPENGSG